MGKHRCPPKHNPCLHCDGAGQVCLICHKPETECQCTDAAEQWRNGTHTIRVCPECHGGGEATERIPQEATATAE